jgi:hypothetical protein
MRGRFLLFVLFFLPAARASAEWQMKPFIGATFAGSSTYTLDLDGSTAKHPVVGISGTLLGEVLGVEAEVCHARGFFETDGPYSQLVLSSSATTLTGNVVVALPRRLAEYKLRPYFVGGGGLMRARIDDAKSLLPVSSNLASWDMGVGVTGFLSDRFGVSWDVRYFRSVGGNDQGAGLSTGPEQVSFWRANMALAIRY